jgi:hypothetical protein
MSTQGENSGLSEDRLRELEASLSSSARTSRLLGCNRQRAWLWRRGIDHFYSQQLAVLEKFLVSELTGRLATLKTLEADLGRLEHRA